MGIVSERWRKQRETFQSMQRDDLIQNLRHLGINEAVGLTEMIRRYQAGHDLMVFRAGRRSAAGTRQDQRQMIEWVRRLEDGEDLQRIKDEVTSMFKLFFRDEKMLGGWQRLTKNYQ